MKNFYRYLLALFITAVTVVVVNATIIGSLPYTLTNGTTADATQVMANYQKIIDDVNANAAARGVNSDITALTALSTPLTAAQGGTTVYNGGTSTGSANAQTVASVVPSGMTLAAGQTICFTPGFTNTAATTLVANGLAAKSVFRQSPAGVEALTGGEIVLSARACAAYDGTQYILLTPGYLASAFGPVTTLASAATTDLGTIPSHNVSITGTTTITAFGSTASATYPVYLLKFTGSLTLTYNATSLILPGAATITTQANDTATALYLGSGNWQVTNYSTATPGPKGRLIDLQIFTSSGTWTKPSGTNGAWVRCVGPGGGGGAADTGSAGNGSEAAGGGAGGYIEEYITSGLGATETVTIGTGGAGASAANTAGADGSGASSFGAFNSAGFGLGGAGMANGSTGLEAVGGAGGTNSGATISVVGQAGANAWRVQGTSGSGFGGGGGSTSLGEGGRGAISTGGTQNGSNGVGYGSGGGGGGSQASGQGDGGDGKNGICIVASYS